MDRNLSGKPVFQKVVDSNVIGQTSQLRLKTLNSQADISNGIVKSNLDKIVVLTQSCIEVTF